MRSFMQAASIGAASATIMGDMDYKFMGHIAKHGKSYATMAEYEARMELFAETDAKIVAHNATNSSYRLGHNRFSD